jgi:hypothetical protein
MLVDAIGVLKVCTPVNVLAASVLANVAEVVGNVIVVETVPEKVSVLFTVKVLPATKVKVEAVAGCVKVILFILPVACMSTTRKP